MMLRRLSFLLATTLLIVAGARTAAAVALPPMMPLDVGNHWEYVGPGGTIDVQGITGTLEVRGRTVAVKHEFQGPDAGLDNWWMTGPSGEVLLAGFDNPNIPLSLAYDPPIVYCGGAPILAETWTTTFVAYEMPGETVYGTGTATYSALELPTLTLPAGSFEAVAIGWIPNGPASTLASGIGTFTLDGHRVSATTKAAAATATPRDWFARAVGVVQWSNGDLYQLTSFGNPTPTLASTWGRLKALYR